MKISKAELRKIINEELRAVLEAKIIDFPGGKKDSGDNALDGEGEVIPLKQPELEPPTTSSSPQSLEVATYAAYGLSIGYLLSKVPRKDLTIEELISNPAILEKLVYAMAENQEEFLEDWKSNKPIRSKYLGEPEVTSPAGTTRKPAVSVAKDLTARDRADDELRDSGVGAYREVGVEIPEKIRKIARLSSDGVAPRDLTGAKLEKVKKEIRTALSKAPNGGKGSSVYNELQNALEAKKISKYDVYDLSTALQEMAVELLDK